jgi:hypothetical protein
LPLTITLSRTDAVELSNALNYAHRSDASTDPSQAALKPAYVAWRAMIEGLRRDEDPITIHLSDEAHQATVTAWAELAIRPGWGIDAATYARVRAVLIPTE